MAEVHPTGLNQPTGTALQPTAEQAKAAEKRQADQSAALKKQHEDAEAQVKANAELKEETNTKTMERQNNSRPTPTQEENDLAAAGAHVDEKEYDGSPPQGTTPQEAVAAAKYYKQPEETAYAGATLHRKSEAGASGSQYKTRAATAKSP